MKRDATLAGWNEIPLGYGADFDTDAAPWWLRAWFNVPLVDRYAYPVMVRRGHAYLTPHPGWVGEVGTVAGGWRLRDVGEFAP
ncbi:MAG: hypothetical protein M3O32_08655 [Actinomycetota bacterium]|nr:hypothetical protein [Actinomycetota bacterium]